MTLYYLLIFLFTLLRNVMSLWAIKLNTVPKKSLFATSRESAQSTILIRKPFILSFPSCLHPLWPTNRRRICVRNQEQDNKFDLL
jgi:hypothetical protein